MKRYETPGPWSVDKYYPARAGHVTILVGPAVDTRTCHTYAEGAHKVCVTGPSGKPRTRTFIGETAWYKAEAYATDAVCWLNAWTRPLRRNESNDPSHTSVNGGIIPS